MEELFIRSLSGDTNGVDEKNALPWITSRLLFTENADDPTFRSATKENEGIEGSKQEINFKELVLLLCKLIKEDPDILYFLIFVAGVEKNEELTQMIRESSDNLEGYEPPEHVNKDPYDIITTDLRVLDRSFKHALSSKSLPLIKYVLNGADKCFINASINDEEVLGIIEWLDDEECQDILKFLCK